MERKSLDTSSYESVYGSALKQIKEHAPWWTHREVSDPGITLLEMWSVLVDMQSFYLDQVQDSHYRKYLKLLGIELRQGKCAAVWVNFEGVESNIRLPGGTRLTADKMVFETEEEAELSANSLSGFFINGKNIIDVMSLKRKSGFVLNRGNFLFSFCLRNALKAGEKITFFVLLDEKRGRNPLGDNDSGKDFFLVRLAWEYRTAAGWKEARVVRDDTRGLLYSGCICLQTEDAMAPGDLGWEIRCRVAEGSYDMMPVIYKISLNVIRVVQKNTLCCSETAEFTGETHRVEMKSYLGQTGELRVLRLQEKGLWRDITKVCKIDPPITAIGQERGVRFSGEGTVKIICTVPGALSEFFPCAVSGVASQKLFLPWDNVMPESVELLLAEREDSDLYRICRCLKEPEEICEDYAWHWQKNNEIVLGDGRHGEIPPAARKGLLPCSMVLWEGSRGNISIGRIKNWENPELFPKMEFTNLLTGSGGEDRLSPREQFQELVLSKDKLAEQNRMVTEEDIRTLVKKTPGLIIGQMKVEWREGTITVTVIPVKGFHGKSLVETYRSCIQEHLEQYRPVGSRIRIKIAGEK